MLGFNCKLLLRDGDYCIFNYAKIVDYWSTFDDEILDSVNEFIAIYEISSSRTVLVVYLINNTVYDELFNVCEVPSCVSALLSHFVSEL